MKENTYFVWIPFYTELADKLLQFKDNRVELIRVIRDVYNETGIKLPTLERENNIVDIDPFSVYGLFNKQITEKNRIAIAEALGEALGVSAKVPSDFSGLPVMNNLNATFYYFSDLRQPDDIQNLWNLFEEALYYADSPATNYQSFIEAFNIVLKQKGILWNITMGLYWIRPNTFLALDSRNRWYLTDKNKTSSEVVEVVSSLKTVPDGEKYLDLISIIKKDMGNESYSYSTIPELSYQAWITSEEDNAQELAEKKGTSNAAFLRWFGPLLNALKDLGGSAKPTEAKEKIAENEKLTKKELEATRGKTHINKFSHEVDWARFYLVKSGYMDGSVQGIWALTEDGYNVEMTDELATDILRTVHKSTNKDALGDSEVQTKKYWLYSPGEGAKMWDQCFNDGIMILGWSELEDYNQYLTKEDIRQALIELRESGTSQKNAAHAVWQFAHEISVGDLIIVKRGRSEVLGKGIVESDYYYDPEVSEEYPNIRKVNWTNEGKWPHPGQAAMKTLTEITSYTDYVEQLMSLFEDEISEEDVDDVKAEYPPYTEEDFLSEVFITEDEYDALVGLIKNKKNVILQGAPGVGKTFAARRLAYSMMGEKDKSRVMMVQFHQSYSYEDFIMGFRPTESGFELKKGAFYNFCKEAEIDSDNDYYFIIDEINRGNLSKIFGELFMLIESDKRGAQLQLLYSNEKFSVPNNVYIIGMMNTADRSLAMLDYALRRRFAFYEMKPGFETDGFREYQGLLDSEKFNSLIDCVRQLNDRIINDDSLGEGFCIGHSYFCNLKEASDDVLASIVQYELIPLLKEYWFDEPTKVKEWSEKLRRAIA